MPPIYDLHSHSTCSDGVLTPAALVSRAKACGVNVLAVTDHDSIAGLEEASAAAAVEGIDIISGIEFSSQWRGRGVHIVGLNVDVRSPVLLSAVEHQQQCRSERAATIAKRLAKAGVSGALEGAMAIADGESLGRPHFARYLVESGHVANINQAFKRYLGAGKMGDVKSLWPEVSEVVGWIAGAGGVAVLAHPMKYKLTRTKLCSLTEHFASSGGAAMEVVSGKQAVGMAENLVKIAQQFHLRASLGSDFHIPGQPWQELGCCGQLPATASPVWELWR